MKKMAVIALVAIGVAAFVGTDVIKSSVGSVRIAVRDALTSEVPLTNQLAEAQAQIDTYAESIIRGEVAAENLRDMIGGVEREVRGLSVRVDRERTALATLRDGFGTSGEAVPASLKPENGPESRVVLRRVRSFQAGNELLVRRTGDLERLHGEYEATLASLEKARAQQARLGEEVRVLAAEVQSLQARKAAASTRAAVGDASIHSSGFADAQAKIAKIRSKLRQQNKLLQYYAYERVERIERSDALMTSAPTDPATAIDAALAAYPGR